jgi:predicted deacylase
MKHLGMIDVAPEPKEESRVIWSTSWIRAKHAGLFQPTVQSGQHVNKGDWIGTITDPFGEFKEKINAADSGYVLGLNNIPVINAGDALLLLGFDNFCRLEYPIQQT